MSGIFLSHFKSSTVLVTTLSLCHYGQPILSNDTVFARGPIWPMVPSLHEPRGECDHWSCQCSATRAEPLMMVDPISGYIMACLTLRTLTMVPASMTLLMLLSPVSSYLHMSVMLRTQQCLPPGTGCPLLTPQLTDTAGLCSQSPQLTEGAAGPASHYHYQLCFGLGPPGGEWCLAGE